MEIINGMLSGGIVAVLCGIVFFGIPKIFEGLIYKGLEFRIQKAISKSNANYEIELEKLRVQNKSKLQEELERIKMNNSIKLNEIQLQFQKEYQNAEQNFSERIDFLKIKYAILPELYKNVLTAFSYVTEKTANYDDINDSMVELNNFIVLNEFYLNEDIFDNSVRCKETMSEMFKERKKSSNDGKDFEKSELFNCIFGEYLKEVESLKDKIKAELR
ncbi:hypothetical protein AB6878_06460 [Carnobacterium maltaromaticum]|uniref:hypothetical protein n=1 Tax=Carnobacterium maltaromaticum TaxID=2751 RepID=UPI0039BE854C